MVWEAAAVIAGGSSTTIHVAVRAGEIHRRHGHFRGVPTLEPESVEAWAEARWIAASAARAKRQERLARSGQPGDGDMWLTATTVALVLGLSMTRVDQLARPVRHLWSAPGPLGQCAHRCSRRPVH